MAKLSDIRDGIATRLRTISGLRVRDYVEGQVEPPMALVGFPSEIDYDEAMARGMDDHTIPIRVYVASQVNRAANDALEGYLAKTAADDPKSIKAAIEGDRTLGGKVQDCVVRRMTGAGVVEHGSLQYLAADFELTILD
jgi:hypothetical protein